MENLRAIALMVLSMAGFAVEDMLIKYIALEMPTGQFLMLIGAGGALSAGFPEKWFLIPASRAGAATA